MNQARLLLLSSSKVEGEGWLESALVHVKNFLPDTVDSVLFVPFAAVRLTFDTFAAAVRERFQSVGIELNSIHQAPDPRQAVAEAQAIVVGGGNTFQLLDKLYEFDLLDPIRERVAHGMPYIGWSAGSNVACPTIKTTNDMPIIQPPSFAALGLVRFQINPHYLDAHPSGHHGETREERLIEFIEVNPEVHVVGLREGSALRIDGDSISLLGSKWARIFLKGEPPRECEPGKSVSFPF